MSPIETARQQGFTDEEILAYVIEKNPAIGESANQALSTGYSASEVLSYLTTAGPVTMKKGQQLERGDVSTLPQQERGIIPSFTRGLAGSVSGLVTGRPERVAPEDAGFVESISEMAGGLIGDLPAMVAGGAAGGAAGTAVLPGIGTAIGAGAGSFALPSLIRQTFAEYRDYAKGGGEGTFGEFLERSGRIGVAGVKGAALGALTSQASRLLPVLKRMPRFEKLLNTRIGKAIEQPAAEVATLTAGQAALEGKAPTAEDLGMNIAAVAGFKAAKGITGAIKKNVPFEEQDIKAAKERTTEKLAKAKDVGVDLAKRFNKLLPESIQKFNTNLVEDISKRVQNWTDKKEQAKRETFIGMVEKHSGKKAGEMMRSHYKWRETLETPIDTVDGKDIYLSPQNLQDMMFYRQRTHNPNIDGDTAEALEKRLPEKAKKIVDETIDEHFKTWLQRWNDNPATMKKINPREGLEDIYLPGVWEETSDKKMTAAMKHADEMLKNHPDKTLKQAFKLNGPFANTKVFETYAKGMEEGGLTPRYKNIKDLLRYHDEMMIRLEANNELMDKIRKWQDANGQKLFVLSDNKEAYDQAKKDGWIPFEDKFMRMRVVGKTEDGKPQWEVSPDRALVDPAFAKAVQGVFRKEFYKPEHPAWKAYDNLSSLMKVMRVSLSPFHVVALAEGGVGSLGTDFFKGIGPLRRFFSNNWWNDASKAFEDIDGLAWRAEMGLNFKRPDPETYKKGQELLSEASAIPSKESNLKKPFRHAANLVQKSHKWIFEEYHPRLKIATFDTYLSRVLERMAKEGKDITPELREKVARDVSRVVNNQFGGLNWETITTMNLNDPQTQKWMRRMVGYPDWSVSTVRQAADAFMPGTSGELAREYWIRHLSGWLAATYVMRFLYGGLSNKDDKENTFTWNPSKAFKALNTKDPNALIEFPLPDVKLNIAGVEFNPGRDEKGRRLHAGFGKQIKEIPRYVTEPVDAVFSKANPMLTSIFKQAFGVTPYKGETFPVRGKQKGGSFLPWDATVAGTPRRALSRATEFAGELLPFSFRGLDEKGVATTLATGFGAIPTRKSMSLKASEPYIYDALRNKNPRKLKEIIDVLKDGGYDDKQIRNRIRLIKQKWVPSNELDMIARTAKKTKDTD